MPYLPSDARLKSDYYQKILDSDIIEQEQIIADLKGKQQVSGSIDSNTQLRDENGYLVSVESPYAPGKALEQSYELVRLENKQEFFNSKFEGKIDNQFKFFKPPVELDVREEVVEREIITKELRIEEKKSNPEIPLKKMFIRFVNVSLNLNYNVNTTDADLLHANIAKIIKKELSPRKKISLSNSAKRFITASNGLPQPPSFPNFKMFVVGSLQGLIKLSLALKNSNYKEIYEYFILPNAKLRKVWEKANGNGNASAAEFDAYENPSIDNEDELRGKGYIT